LYGADVDAEDENETVQTVLFPPPTSVSISSTRASAAAAPEQQQQQQQPATRSDNEHGEHQTMPINIT
jgi:hypothetical protein